MACQEWDGNSFQSGAVRTVERLGPSSYSWGLMHSDPSYEGLLTLAVTG